MAKAAKSSKKSFASQAVLAVIFLLIGLAACLLIVNHLSDTPISGTAVTGSSSESKLKLPADFNLNDKIGQLLIVGVTSQDAAINLEKQYQIGGFLIRTGSDLFSKTATNNVAGAGQLPPLFAVDEEGGQVSRLPAVDFTTYSAKYMGGLSDDAVKSVAYGMAQAMNQIGASVDFAPVVDLDNGQNAAISQLERAFSSQPSTVGAKASAFAAGLRQGGVAPTFKHFPGLGYADGPTQGDTDAGPATTPDLATLEVNDLLPYTRLLQPNLIGCVMVGNQIVPGLTNQLPASLSSAAYNLLRTRYHFNQVVFTDELLLAKAVTEVYPDPADAVIAAIKAGADMPLIDTDNPEVVANIISGVASAVQNGQIKQAQINASLARILKLKSSLM